MYSIGQIVNSFIFCAFVLCVMCVFVRVQSNYCSPLIGEVIYSLFVSTGFFGKFEISTLASPSPSVSVFLSCPLSLNLPSNST